ncbi:MAG TPA: pyrroloquinoline quinone-dependent dehydrogenase [Gemmatimonadales bacterium]|jgi:quinoprotein glucose dehydrogenase|nr:pyrroloquinoline quinone-dependent dehydrogenase [Gemmatimonadales bacterium]
MHRRHYVRLATLATLVVGLARPALAQSRAHPLRPQLRDAIWSNYGADPAGTRYSPATQITRANISRLEPAWTYRTGALDAKTDLIRKAAFESTPILAEGKLLLTTPYNHVIALEPTTGVRLWEYDPRVNLDRNYSEVTSRGAAAWTDPKAGRGHPCRLRIFIGTLDGRLIALDGETGRPCAGFGTRGTVDLTRGADPPSDWTGGYQVTSAPAVYRDLVITGSSIADNWKVSTGRGIVRAFDARTGRLRWTWDPIPWAAGTKPPTGAGNAWSTLSIDEAHDLVFVPTSSPAPDYYGGLRKGDDRWANSVVALRASTGKLVWGFQVVHHDLWDYDVAAQPTLFTWKDGTPAVVINTKMGHVFVLNRLTGKPLLPIEERAVPATDVPGEQASPTQPFSTISLVPERFGPDDAWGPTPADSAWCADKIRRSRSEGIFTPPSLKGTVVVPGNVGGVNWGGAAYDPERHLMVANTNRLVAWVRMIPRAEYHAETMKDQDNRLFGEFGDQEPAPYGIYRTFLFSPSRTPCNAPPWGTTAAVDLFTGKTRWETPLGTMVPGKTTGSINLGGPMVTAGGLMFTAAAIDPVLRAFDSETGKELWSHPLPASGQATPMSYAIHGTQYVVIAAGGHGKLGSKQGDYVVAFRLAMTRAAPARPSR